MHEHDSRSGEIGFLIAPGWRGRGFATAAAGTLARWGLAELGLARVQWRAAAGNEASWRVAEKAGFRSEGWLRQAMDLSGRRVDCRVAAMVSEER